MPLNCIVQNCIAIDITEIGSGSMLQQRLNYFGNFQQFFAPVTLVSRVLSDCGHKVIVAKPVRLKLIHKSSRKSDRVDACALGRFVRVDPQLLIPVQHRSDEDQSILSVLGVRDLLVSIRTKLIIARVDS